MADMHSARRARAVARPRQAAMYLAKQMTTRSLPDIGRRFGGRANQAVNCQRRLVPINSNICRMQFGGIRDPIVRLCHRPGRPVSDGVEAAHQELRPTFSESIQQGGAGIG
jgi:hypothetical protein